MKKSEGTFQVY